MTYTPARPPAEPPTVRELLARFGRLSQVTEEALWALARGEVDQLTELVDQREEMLAPIAPLLREVVLLRQRSERVPEPGLRSALAEVEKAGRDLLLQSQQLMEEISLRKSEIAAELTGMSRAAAARTAYSRPAPSPPVR